ncbi:4-hydroxy-3-methylbut-2-enyl diphosphate reductase [Bifidobacterium favimelis]|uniref:4-hydroxy-3-methylbut-2-enyl diphosphate reductase n=1 Tax=Bifidobacterium favimelis TaxID=3122979 RepID=A0ABU8ZQ02_9BIFI
MQGFRPTGSADGGGRRVILADPRGFCAGVDRAIQTVSTILDRRSQDASGRSVAGGDLPPVYVRRQIVHNRHVVEDLAGRGAVFVDELGQIPDRAVQAGVPVVFSAHGIAPAVQEEADRRGMNVIDASCPLVSKVHREVHRFVRNGYQIVYIGHRGHDEAIGVVGEAPDRVHLIEHVDDIDSLDFTPDVRLVMLTQTTLSLDETAEVVAALKERFPWIEEPPGSDICYATQNRQQAVKLVAGCADCVVIVGSANSSNSVRLVEVAQSALDRRFAAQGVDAGSGGLGRAHRVDDAGELDPSWFAGLVSVGVSSGASVPEDLVDGVLEALAGLGFDQVTHAETIKENMHFVLPSALRGAGR